MSSEIAVRLWGEKGEEYYVLALNACHAFAQNSGAPPGVDVFRWIAQQHLNLVCADNSDKLSRKSEPTP